MKLSRASAIAEKTGEQGYMNVVEAGQQIIHLKERFRF
jgi:hypothetical protein